jgi:predicted GNAT family N-acyltransferase
VNTPVIEALAKNHIKEDFDCGKPALTTYLRSIASQHQKKGLGRTYVAVEAGSSIVLGYYTLSAGKVSYADWPDTKRAAPNMSVPTILLGRLAVDTRAKGQKLGEYLLFHAMWTAERASQAIGAVAFEVDVLDEDALSFYQRYSFQVLKDNPLHLYLPFDTIRGLNLDFNDADDLPS